MTPARLRTWVVATLVLLAWARAAGAQAPALVTLPVAGEPVTVLADRLEHLGREDRLIAVGNVEIVRGAARLSADRVEIDRRTGDAVAVGNVVFFDGDNRLTGERLEYNLRTGTGVVHQADARAAPYYRLRGERMERLGDNVYRVHRGAFTTCEDEPPTWSFRFRSATADLEDFVWGTGASFWVKRIPLLPFFPVFGAPIRRERQTGFLFPKVGTSSRRGIGGELPFYWAISDSQDLTIAPLGFAKLGTGVSGEYRYVLSSAQRGSMRGFVLHESEVGGANRSLGSVRHDWLAGPGLRLKADVNLVSDDFVLRDYGDQLKQRSAQRVESNVFVTRTWDAWNLVGRLFAYQDLTTTHPVELHRLPDLSLLGTRQPVPGLPGFLWEADVSFVNFVREAGSSGMRFDLHPRLSRPISPGGLFTITPFVGGRVTAYDKTVTGFRAARGGGVDVEITEDSPRVRRLVEAGTDIELTATRRYAAGGWGGLETILHSVEPRVTYTWLVGENQSRLPLWTEAVDRISDRNRLEYSLINRIRGRTVAPPGTEAVVLELVRLTVAHAYDLRRDRTGDVTADLILQPTEHLRFRGDVGYAPGAGDFQFANTDVSVVFARVAASVGTRYNAVGRISFLQGAVAADLSRHVTARASSDVDLRTGTFVEQRLAVDLRFQCWGATIEYVGRRHGGDEVRFAVNLLGVGGPVRTAIGLGALDPRGQK